MTIRNIDEANQTLLKIGRLQRDIQEQQILLNDTIEQQKKLFTDKARPMRDELEAADELLLKWIKNNPQEFVTASSKSTELPFGTIGLKDGRMIPVLKKGHRVEEVAKQLYRAGFKQCVNIRYRLIKTALVNVQNGAERLAKFNIRFRQKKNVPYYTINEQKIAEEK